MSQLKVAVCVPFTPGRFVPPEFAISIATLQWPTNCSYGFLTWKHDDRGFNRNQLVKLAKQFNAEYIWFLDDDTVPPANALRLLLKELEQTPEAAICGGIYTTKADRPFEPLVFIKGKRGPYWRWQFGDIFPVESLGTGCMLIRTSIFDEISEPWFKDIQSKDDLTPEDQAVYDSANDGLKQDPISFSATDDVYFCHKVNATGKIILAHGGVLPVHYRQDGHPAVLECTDFPVRNVDPAAIWYHSLLPPNYFSTSNYVENSGDGLPAGWLTLPEVEVLRHEAKDLKVLEFGSYKGRSTVVMAEVAAQVVCVDTFEGTGEAGNIDTLGTFLTNILPYPNVTPIITVTTGVEHLFPTQSFDLVFVDAAHDFESVKADLELAKKFGKRIIAHDWNAFDVAKGADAVGLQPLWVKESLAELVPKG